MSESDSVSVGRRKLARTNTARLVRLARVTGLVGLVRLAARKELGACCDLLQQIRPSFRPNICFFHPGETREPSLYVIFTYIHTHTCHIYPNLYLCCCLMSVYDTVPGELFHLPLFH